MTLYKQLVVGMVAVFILLMTSVFMIEFNTTRGYLEEQQRSEVSNTINTVGLALAPYLEEKDKVAVESVINALFDGSSYSVVRLIFLDTGDDILRSYPVKPTGVPEWFTNLNLFEPVHDRRVITSGWMQLAEVEIVSHPGPAYDQLWQAFIRLLSIFGTIFLLGLVSISWILKRALRPLSLIITKMDQIAKNQFGEPLARPKTKDLTLVVDGINHMSTQVELAFKNQAKEAQKLRERAYIDPVSQLGNRAYYMSQLTQWLEESSLGGLAVLKAEFISEEYDEKGYQDGDALVHQLAEQLQASISSPDITIARISSDEFGFIMPNIDESELKLVAGSIVNCIQNLGSDPTGTANPHIALGVTYSNTRKTSTEIMSLVDNALSSAKANRELTYGYVTADDHGAVMGKQQWRMLVEEAIINDLVTFRLQAANNSFGKTYHQEVFSAIEKEGVRYGANQYLYALEQLEMSHILDQYVIEKMIEKLNAKEVTSPVAINISPSSISQPSFIRWIGKTLEHNASIAHLLHFEIPENCFINVPHYTALLCNTIRNAESVFGVDNYGRNFQSLDYINEYRPSYVKLDYLFTHNLDDEKQKFTLTSISRTAHNLGITTIASRIETQTQLDILSDNYVEVFQGFIVDK
ncbi:diguanylate cyclase [Vibrio splendidus]|uniref:bifunctional diguanylate cyclase/phosphodiesterase n=1 Tax=Vibrio splendidus TaxID=29497 RepID=UPI000D39560E|nr:LapD/MoxY N-terminal periplasmic domain-containing protein [Vibrio splendidus]PTP83996.1 diguanylate cyclase [Vibrio splendidus]